MAQRSKPKILPATRRPATWLICAALALATLAAYWRVPSFEFVTYDDPDFIANNPYTQAGLTAKTVAWAFHSEVARNWHPVTMLTHALDCQLFGLRPGPPHVVNLLLHIADTLLLFLLLRRLTGALWPSASVAAFFALHPLHVESVAWIAERKDVLSTLLWLLTTWAYVRYAEQFKVQGSRFKVWYGAALGLFAIGLMCKPMLVTLPFVLLLLDFWPLRRLSGNVARAVLEKVPFLALSAVDCVITYSIQQHGGSVLGVSAFPMQARIGNALVSYVSYLERMVLPYDLAGLYIRHRDWPGWQVGGAALFLIIVTAIVLWQARKRPYLVVGWLWYVGTLVPVIGLVQVGMQSMADRYAYVPLIGIFIMIAWWVADLRLNARAVAAVTAGLLAACIYLTERQSAYWHDSETLFRRMIAATDRNYMAHFNLGNVYSRQKRTDDAIAQYQAALRDEPNYADAANNLGGIYLDLKRYDEALAQYRDAVRIYTDFTHCINLANALADAASARRDTNEFAEADEAFRKALSLNPASALAHHNFGLTWQAQGKPGEAMAEFAEAVRLDPSRVDSHSELGLCYAMQGDMTNAARELSEVVRLQPDNAGAYGNLGNALAAQNRFDEALAAYTSALRLNPSDYQTEFNLGLTFMRQGRNAEAREHLRAALRLKPDYSEARRALDQIP